VTVGEWLKATTPCAPQTSKALVAVKQGATQNKTRKTKREEKIDPKDARIWCI